MRCKILYSIFLFLVFQTGLYAQGYYSVRRIPISTSSFNEMAPVIYKNGIIFSSNKKNNLVLVTVDQDGNYMYN